MAYAPPQRYRTPNGADVLLPPEVAAGFVGFEPVEPPPESDMGAPSVPIPPPVDQSLLATPPTMPPPEEPTLAAAVGDIARPGLVQDAPASPVADAALAQPAPPTGPGQGGADPGGAPSAPPPQPTTPADLMAGGYAPVLDQQREAMALERAAGVEQIAADKRSAEEEARAIAASGQRDVTREAERARIQQATLADIAQRSAAIDGEIDRIANTKIDTSIRRPAVAAIAIAMGAIGAALAGKNDGSNPALDIILKQIDASAQRQMAERDAAVRTVGLKRDQLAGLRSKLTDTNALYDGLAAAETRRIRTEMARIGAASKSDAAKANLAKLDAMLAGKEAEYLDGAKTKQFALDDREKQRKEQERHAKEMESQGRQGLALQKQGLDLRRDELAAGKDAAIAKAVAEGKNKQAEDIRKFGVAGLKRKSGEIPLARDEKTAGLLTAKITAAGEINDIVNEVIAIRDRSGGASSALNSDDFQKLSMLQDRLNVLAKQGTEGLSSENDMKLLAGALGAKDITSFRARAAGLEAGRDRTTAALNRELRQNFPDVEPVKFANMYAKAPGQTAEEKKFTAAVQKPKVSIDDAQKQAKDIAVARIRQREGLGPLDKIPAEFNSEIAADMKQAASEYKDISPNTRAFIGQQSRIALRGDKLGDDAFRYLVKLSEQGETKRIREEALDAIQQIGMHSASPKRDDKGNTLKEEQ